MAHLQNGFGLLPPNIATIPWAESLDKPLGTLMQIVPDFQKFRPQFTKTRRFKRKIHFIFFREVPNTFPGPHSWWHGPAIEHWSLADVLSLSCARLVANG